MALRQQLRVLQRTARPRFCARDRMFCVLLARAWRSWRSALVVVQPETVIRWHSGWLRRRWARCSGRNRKGRPPLGPGVRRLIVEMATANPLWGAPASTANCGRSGFRSRNAPYRDCWRVCRSTLSNVAHVPREPCLGTCVDGFLHRADAAGSDVFVFVVLSHHRRGILHVNCTAGPTSAWTAQQLVEAFPDDTAPQWLLRDRDNIYDERVRRRIASLGITEVVSSPRSPWQNRSDAQDGGAECREPPAGLDRRSGSEEEPGCAASARGRGHPCRADPRARAKRERLRRPICKVDQGRMSDRIIPVGDRHFRRVVAESVEHYHRERNNQGLDNRLIAGAPVSVIAGPRTGTLRAGKTLSRLSPPQSY